MNGPKRSLPRWRRGLAAVLTAVVAAGLVEPAAAAEPYQMPPDRPGRPAVQSYPAVPVDVVAEVPAPTVDTTPGEQRSRAPKGRYSVPLTDAAAGFTQAGDSTIEVAAAGAGDGQITVQVLDASSAAAVGAPGLAVRVTADQPTDVTVKVPDDLVAEVIGADFDSRVVWSVAPDGAAASTAEPVATSETTTSEAAGSLTATQVQTKATPAGATLLAASGSTASDGSGSFGATSLSASSSWQMSGNTGSFTWSYPLTAPPATGPAPSLALAYDSGSVDGRTGSTNNQTSGLGEGWDLAGGGFIERSYASCSQDGQTTSADLCWSSDNATVSLAGHSGTLVKDSSGTWRLQTDDGTKVEKLTGTSNGDNDGEYWKLTTTDGTQYFFGRNRLPGWVSGKPETGSTWTVPVFGNQAGEPCNNTTFATSSCTQAWRWNLDHVVDVHGNAEAFYYDKQQNAYLAGGVTKTTYDMGGYLTRVDYAMRTGNEYGTAPARVVLDNIDRCESTTNCTQSNTANWPDVPWDLYCLSTACTGKINPSFFVTKKLAAVRTQVHNGTAYVDVDKWAFTQTFPATGDGTSRSLWLASIARTGYGGGTNLTVPAVTFTGTALQNRVWAVDGLAPLMKYRINSITTQTGASTAITYSPVDCTPTTLPAATETNGKRCFPQRWVPPAPAPQTERLDWFHKYVVTTVSVNPGPNSGSPVETTNYDYQGAPAWKYTKEPIVPADKRTWSVYAGYAQVKTRHGDPATPSRQETTLTTYFRGLDGDRLNPAGGTRSVNVAASDGSTFTDGLWLAGQTRETTSYVGDGGARVANTITTPWLSPSIGSDGTNEVRRIGTAEVTTRTALAAGGDQTVTTATSNDDLGRPVTVDDRGDTSTNADDRCTRTSYADNTGLNLLNFPAETTVVGVACAQTPTLPQDALSQTRQYYDGSGTLGEAPTRGLATRTDVAVSYDGSNPTFQTQTTGTFDDLGRPLTTTDPRLDGNPRTTSTAYTPTTGLLTKTVVTNPLNWTLTTTLDPTRGSTLTTVDMNGNTTEATYDALGRRAKVWLPNRPRSSNASSPSSSYQYTISNTAPSWTSTTTITAAGSPSTIFQLFDGLLRPRQTQTPQTNADARVITDTRYDAAGRVSTTNDAYNATGAPSGTLVNPTVSVPSGTVVKYDGAGRTIADIKLGNGTEMWRTGYTYGGNVVSVTPPAGGTATATVTNAQGKPVQVKQFTAAGTPTGAAHVTNYTYDHADRMTSMTDAEGNRWTWTFDLLGRTVTAVDPDAGTTTTSYDPAGRVATVTDGRGQTVATTYDVLDRPTGRYDATTTGTQLAAWTYDTTAKGQPYEATRIVGADQYVNRITSYDKLYKPTGQQVLIPASAGAALAGTYTYAMTYGPDGTLTSRTLPATAGMPSEKLIYGYDTLGRLAGLNSSQGAYLSGVYRNELGELAQTMRFFGNNELYQVFTRNASTQRIVTSESLNAVNGVTTTIGKHEYTYNNAGLLTADRTTATGLAADHQCYRYDYKQQLTDAWTPNATTCAAAPGAAGYAGPAPYRVSYAYSASGNRLRETRHTTTGGTDQVRTYTYPTPGATAVRPHATTNVTITGSGPGTTTFGYDNAGNTTTQGSQTLTYNTEGRLAGITAGASTQNRIYDANGNLLLLTSSTTGTQLFLGETILTATTGATAASGSRIYTAGGLQLAERTTTNGTTNTLTYLDANNQNTVTARISTNGTITRVYHRPYGYTRSPTTSWTSQRGYLGQPHNTQVGLTHLGARDYDPVHGRFITVDPVLVPDNPLQNNGYNYAANNPIQYSDPDGRCFQNSKGFYEGINCGGGKETLTDNQLSDAPWANYKLTTWEATRDGNGRYSYRQSTRGIVAYSPYATTPQSSETIRKIARFVADKLGITTVANCVKSPSLSGCVGAAIEVAAATPWGKAAKTAAWVAKASWDLFGEQKSTDSQSAPRFITNGSGETLDTSRITIPEGKYNYLLNSPEKSGVFRESMGFDRPGLDSALQTHLISNFGTATPDGPMTGGGKKFNVRGMMTGPSGQTWDIITAWGVDTDGTVRLITATPPTR